MTGTPHGPQQLKLADVQGVMSKSAVNKMASNQRAMAMASYLFSALLSFYLKHPVQHYGS